ncbi:unnamed protein product [Rhizophagus irregularis]|nr:unnamed protein product [Rhizophagus irregularis]
MSKNNETECLNYSKYLKSKFINWTSGNKRIDSFIQEMQLGIKNYQDVVTEWIPYSQFNEIKETSKNDSVTVYSAIWKNGPLCKYRLGENYARDSYKKVALKCLHSLQDPIEFVINKAEKYSIKNNYFLVLHGISQNPDTNDYILVFNWTSGNEKIDDHIHKRQLKIKDYNDVVYEWIPYNQFNKIEKLTRENGSITVYSAMWKNGPLYKKYSLSEDYARDSNKKVVLKCLHNLQDPIEFVINETKKYSTRNGHFIVLYGISQNPDTNDYILIQNHITWIIFEWIPYNQFNEIDKTSKNDSITVYSAMWKDGPLHCNYMNNKYTRDSNKKVALKCMHNLQDPIEFIRNETKKYSTINDHFLVELVLYGISQNPDTNDYILVQNHITWVSGNEEIDDYIYERQLKVKDCNDIIFEWIPYSQFNEIKEMAKIRSITVYSAIWKNGPLYDDLNKKVALKLLHKSYNSIEFVIKEAKKYSTITENLALKLYGMSQNPDTNDYILVFNWTRGNEKIDYFIQEMQLSIKNYQDAVIEWIPYNQFNKIKEIGKNDSTIVYSAIWKYGPLYLQHDKYTRYSNKEVALKLLHNTQDSVEFVINEAKKYSTKNNGFIVLYGISRNPDTNNYILVQNNSINLVNWSGNEKINNFIQEKQLEIKDHIDVVFEWIPYNQFNKIKEIGKNDSTIVYSAIWKNGPLYLQHDKYTRYSNKEVALNLLHNTQDSVEFVINETKKYSTKNNGFLVLYGISQNPDTNDYILVQNNSINLVNWSGNEKIDDCIHNRQLEIKDHDG